MRLKNTLAALALNLSALATLSAPAAPVFAKDQDRPEPARVYKDWVVGCGSDLACEAVVVLPEEDAEGFVLSLELSTREYANASLYLRLHDPAGDTLQPANGPYQLLVDGKVFAKFEWQHDEQDWFGTANRKDSVILANGYRTEILDKNGRRVSLISLSGATAAMRDIDERQGNIGFTHALVVKGKKKEVPSPMRLATFAAYPDLVDSSYTPWSFVLSQAIEKSNCGADRDETDKNFDAVHPLPRTKSNPSQALIFVGCGHGAYNFNVMPYLATRETDGKWALSDIIVDLDYDGASKRPMGMLTNAHWDKEARTLTHLHKGRGLGDCGDSAEYKFEADLKGRTLFRLTEIREMPVCRGATYWPAIW